MEEGKGGERIALCQHTRSRHVHTLVTWDLVMSPLMAIRATTCPSLISRCLLAKLYV